MVYRAVPRGTAVHEHWAAASIAIRVAKERRRLFWTRAGVSGYVRAVASYLLHFTKGLVPAPAQMPQLARDLVRRGLYGIPATAMLRHRIRPGALVVVTVGSPHRVFVADAIVERATTASTRRSAPADRSG